MASSTVPRWDPANMEGTLLEVDMLRVMQLTAEMPPHSPLYEYVEARSTAMTGWESPALSYASEDSLDSILTNVSANTSIADDLAGTPAAIEEAEANQLIYRLCRSLYKKALQKTEGRERNRSSHVSVDVKYERNMSRMMDWMPLLHLFDPKSFYAYSARDSPGRATGEVAPSAPENVLRARDPREASRQLLDELEVEKLSGGNSNHVYRLFHPQFPEKSILLRVYGGGDDEAIDRYRDVAAMKAMSKARLAPAVLHTFKWGRVEEYMDSVATGTTDMMIESASLLAEVYTVLHEMHQLPADPFFPQAANVARFKNNGMLADVLQQSYNGPEDYLASNAARITGAFTAAGRYAPYYLSETAVKVMEEVCPTVFERASLRFLRLTSPSIRDSYRSDFVRFVTQEVMAVRGLLQRLSAPVVFAHNDLNPANILLSWRKVPRKFRLTSPVVGSCDGVMAEADDDETDEVTPVVSEQSSSVSRKFLTKKGHHRNLVELKGIVFIDFEYSDANYRAFDLGNTLCELDYDYSRGTENGGPGFIKYLHTFPPPDQEAAWAGKAEYYPRLPELIYTAWEREQAAAKGEAAAEAALDIGTSCLHAVSAYFSRESSAVGLSVLTRAQLTEVLLGMLAAQLHWSLWSFTLACNPDTLTNQTTEDDTFAKGSSGLDYLRYGDCRLKEYLCLKSWMAERHLI